MGGEEIGEPMRRYRASKYHNKITEVDGVKFHSRKEAKRYEELLLLQSQGAIHNLKLQVPFNLTAWDVKICRYVADFVYQENGKEVIEDVKGVVTAIFKLKWKLLQAQYRDNYIYRIT